MDIQEKLDLIEKRRQAFLTQTIDEKNTELIKESYDEYLSAKEINKFAPQQLDQAETNYFKAKYGIDYIDKQKEKYKTESLEMTKEKLKAHQTQLDRVDESLNNYKNSEKYAKSINDVKAMHLARIKELIKKIRLSDIHTNQQKAIFKGQEEDAIRWYIVALNWFIGLFTLFFIFMNRTNINKTTIGQTIFLLTIIFFIKYILYFAQELFKFKPNFGYDPMKSKITWFLYAVSLLVAIWLWVYLDIFTMMYKTPFAAVPATPSIFAGITMPIAGVVFSLVVVLIILIVLLFVLK